MKWDAFLGRLADWFESRGMLEAGSALVVGASAGPDSTLLLHALHDLSQQRALNWTLHAAHFHHGLRGDEADADAEFVRTLAEQLGVRFHLERGDIKARAASENGSTEEIARRERYAFLERVALKADSTLVAVAHHADDNAETVLHRICRGTGLRGLAGISDIRPIRDGSRIQLIRPLLPFRRSALEDLCRAQQIAAREDSTNRLEEFTRNRIRRRVLPLLQETLNPLVADAILRLAEQARWVGGYVEDSAERTFESLVVGDEPQRVALSAPGLLQKHAAIQAAVVRRAAAAASGCEQDLSFTHVESVLRLARDNSSGKEVHLPGPLIVSKRYDRLEFGPPREPEPVPDLPPVSVNCPGQTALPALGLELLAELRDVDAQWIADLPATQQNTEEWVDFDRIEPPLFVRGRRDGDRFRPLGAPGEKTVGDFLSERKLEPAERARTGMLCDQAGPIWVMPLRIDERVKLRPDSRRALRLVLRPINARQAGSA